MRKNFLIILISIFLNFFYFNFILAQTVSLSPSTLQISRNSNFSLTLNISSVNNLFGLAFDLDFNPNLIDFISANEGNFLNQGCQTSLMTAENPPGKLIFGYTRLGASCGGISGSGTLATLNFVSLNQTGTSAISFSNNKLCIFSNENCNYVTGTWIGANVNVTTSGDTIPPAPPTNLRVY